MRHAWQEYRHPRCQQMAMSAQSRWTTPTCMILMACQSDGGYGQARAPVCHVLNQTYPVGQTTNRREVLLVAPIGLWKMPFQRSRIQAAAATVGWMRSTTLQLLQLQLQPSKSWTQTAMASSAMRSGFRGRRSRQQRIYSNWRRAATLPEPDLE